VIRIAASILILAGIGIAIRFALKDKVYSPAVEKIASKQEAVTDRINEVSPSQPAFPQRKADKPVENKAQLAYKESKMEETVTNESEIVIPPEPTMEPKIEEDLQAKSAASEEITKKSKSSTKQALISKVTDSQGMPLSGVSIVEKGTSNTDVTGAVATVRQEAITSDRSETAIEEIQPVPPSGSYNSFRKYIYNNLDYTKFNGLTGKHKVVVEFVVNPDGNVNNFDFKQPVDHKISTEVERVILKSGKWEPGKLDGQNTESKVRLKLTIDLGKQVE
jgi:protein TonB